MSYEMHTDAGHGWLKVERIELVKLGIEAKISAYSYVNGPWAYLEEDCDLGTFARAKGWTANANNGVTVINDGDRSDIREYSCYGHDMDDFIFAKLSK